MTFMPVIISYYALGCLRHQVPGRCYPILSDFSSVEVERNNILGKIIGEIFYTLWKHIILFVVYLYSLKELKNPTSYYFKNWPP